MDMGRFDIPFIMIGSLLPPVFGRRMKNGLLSSVPGGFVLGGVHLDYLVHDEPWYTLCVSLVVELGFC